MASFIPIGVGACFGALAASFMSPMVAEAKVISPNQQLHMFKVGAKRSKEELAGINEYYKPFKLGEIINIAEDVAIFRFLFDEPDTEFDMKPCSTLMAAFAEGGNHVERVERYYTPITPNGEKGYFDIMAKKQNGGRMTEHLFSMFVGETLSFKRVLFKIEYTPNKWKHVGLIGAGTGITPLLQVIRAGLDNPDDTTKISLLFANRRPGMVLLRGLLDDYAEKNPERFFPHYIVDQPDDKWDGLVGHVTDEVVYKTMPKPGPDNLLMMCGPDRFMIKVGGCTEGNLGAMSTRGHVKGCGPQLNNMATIPPHCIIGRLGWETPWVHRF